MKQKWGFRAVLYACAMQDVHTNQTIVCNHYFSCLECIDSRQTNHITFDEQLKFNVAEN